MRSCYGTKRSDSLVDTEALVIQWASKKALVRNSIKCFSSIKKSHINFRPVTDKVINSWSKSEKLSLQWLLKVWKLQPSFGPKLQPLSSLVSRCGMPLRLLKAMLNNGTLLDTSCCISSLCASLPSTFAPQCVVAQCPSISSSLL